MFYWFTLFNYYTFTVGTFKVFNFKKKTIYCICMYICVYFIHIFFPVSAVLFTSWTWTWMEIKGTLKLTRVHRASSSSNLCYHGNSLLGC